MDSLLNFIATVVGASLVFMAGRATSRANANAVDVATFQDLVKTVRGLSEDMILVKSVNRALWSWVYELLDFIKDHGLVPPEPPAILDTDPKLKRLLNR